MSFRGLLTPAVAIASAIIAVVVILAAASTVSPQGTTTRVSAATDGTQGNGPARSPDINSDGRFVAFHSFASNIVPNDTNFETDVFLHDRQTGTTERLSVGAGGVQGNEESRGAVINADGRFVAFASWASNLVASDGNGVLDAFVRDRMSGTTERISLSTGGVEGNFDSAATGISADGRFVAFSSSSTNLVAGDTNNNSDIFLRDRQTGITELVSVDSNEVQFAGSSHGGDLSADARYVTFGGGGDVWIRDRMTGLTEKVDVSSGGTDLGLASNPNINSDGRFVAFQLLASIPGTTQIFLRDRQANQSEQVSVNDSGQGGSVLSSGADVSADGRFVTFYSRASNLEPGDTNDANDVFVRDRQAGTTRRVSVATSGAQAFGSSEEPATNDDGLVIAFDSTAPNLVSGDTNATSDIFVHDRSPQEPTPTPSPSPTPSPTPTPCQTCTPTPTPGPPPSGTTRVSVASDGTEGDLGSGSPDINSDGRFVAFISSASNLVPNDTNGLADVFLHDRQLRTTERLSVATGGVEGNAPSGAAAISADGRYIAFGSGATNLVASDGNGVSDIFVRDRMTSTTERTSLSSAAVEGNSDSRAPAISADGRFVAFESSATNLVLGDTNSNTDIFLRDRQTGITELVSVDSNETQFAGPSRGKLDLSADARYVTFVSGDDVWVRDRTAGLTEKVEVNSSGSDLGRANADSISADGRFVAFELCCPAAEGIYLRDRQTGQIELVSVNDSGQAANSTSLSPDVSADGRFVAFYSSATNLDPNDVAEGYEVFVRDRQAGTTRKVSVATDGSQMFAHSILPAINDNGLVIAFGSTASNLVPGDTNNQDDVFVNDRSPQEPTSTPTPCPTCTPTPTATATPTATPRLDGDSDGWSDSAESIIGTNPVAACGADAWPADINNNGSSDTADIAFVTGAFGDGVPPASPRYDIAPDPPNGFVDTADIARLTGLFGRSCGP